MINRYEGALRAIDSPLLSDELTRSEALGHARHIVQRLAERVSGVEEGIQYALARDIGATRASTGIHASESLRAADALFTCVVTTLAERLGAAAAGQDVALAAVSLQQILANIMRVASDAYTGVLLNRVHQAQVEERRRISRELHDRIGHGVSVAMRNLELYDIYRAEDPVRAHSRVETAMQGLHETVDAVRFVISELRLVEPVESLEKALKLFLEAEVSGDIMTHVEVNGDETWASAQVIEEVFLIVREAFRNTIAHAEATRVVARIDVFPDELRASIVDDGRGFDPAVGRVGGTGLLSMRERAAVLNGSLKHISQTGKGTQVELFVPLGGAGPR
jgi:signal transduction histidine kinase